MSDLAGLTGTITLPIRANNAPGKVRLTVDGMSSEYFAYSSQAIDSGVQVVVYNDRGGRYVDVEPIS